MSTQPLDPEFPVTRLEIAPDRDDAMLPATVRKQLEGLMSRLRHGAGLRRAPGSNGRSGNGYRVLFHGASGTGKTLAAALLGKSTAREVYRIDLSALASRYIGETEKNLARLFETARRHGWILFFDEADALFGKRTAVKDSDGRYANLEVSWLLEQIEGHDGLCILASNLRDGADEAVTQRFDTVIQFPESGAK